MSKLRLWEIKYYAHGHIASQYTFTRINTAHVFLKAKINDFLTFLIWSSIILSIKYGNINNH